MKSLAIMQPYFFPYIGYFQLMNAVDEFVIYDNIEYTKKGWINRNRILVNGKDEYITLPLRKDSDYLQVKDRFLADSWKQDRQKLLNKVRESYRKAPYFQDVYMLVENCLMYDNHNLFDFLFHSINIIKDYLSISAKLTVSSSVNIDHSMKSESKVLALCKALNAGNYINPIGGLDLYSKKTFWENSVHLNFIKSDLIEYSQLGNGFIPWLSILDVLMFNEEKKIRKFLNHFQII